MKLRLDMYLLNTFHVPKNQGVNECVREGRIQKIPKKRYKINKISTLTSPNNSLQNAIRVGIF